MKEGKRVYVNMHVSISTHTLLTVLFFAQISVLFSGVTIKKNEKERKSESEILVYMLHCLALEQVLQQYCCYAQFKYI